MPIMGYSSSHSTAGQSVNTSICMGYTGIYSVSKGSDKRDYTVLVRKGSILHKVGIIIRLSAHTKTPHLIPIMSHLKKHYGSSPVIDSLKGAIRIDAILMTSQKCSDVLRN
jgi:hypothetical protein